MKLCRSHDSNFGVSKIGINYLKQSQCYSNIFCRDHCSHWVCIVFNRRDRYAVVVPASDDCYGTAGQSHASKRHACRSGLEALTSSELLRVPRHMSASKS